jgi:hypothetical protein
MNVDATLYSVAQRIGPDGVQMAIVDVISQKVPFIEEGYWTESSDFTSHHFLQVLSEPVGTDAMVNVGVAWENALTKPVTEFIQRIEVYCRVDVRAIENLKDPEAFRAAQDIMTAAGLKKTIHDRMIYGNNAISGGAQINGLWTRFPNLTSGGVAVANVTDNGGRIGGAQSSTWALKWGLDGVFFTYPRGGGNFIYSQDLGEELVPDVQGLTPIREYTALVSRIGLQFGLCVADPRCCQRLANIDTTAVWNANAQMSAMGLFPDDSYDNVVLYTPRRVWQQMNQAAANKSNVVLSWGEAWGGPVVFFFTVPVRMCERLYPLQTQVAGVQTTLYEPVAS